MFKTILVASDFSTHADLALTRAIELARQGDGSLEIVHAYRPDTFVLPPPLDLIALPSETPTLQHIAAALEVRVQRARANGVSVTAQTLIGPPHEVVVDHARRTNTDLIVVGSRGLGAVAHTLLGSVAEKVVRHAPCPVLVVPRPKD
jgi:universal stress protein A